MVLNSKSTASRKRYMSEVLANVYRGETLESVHRGSFVAVEPGGKIVASFGNPNLLTYWRSAAKSFQAIPFVACGGAEDFSDEEVALACASHAGEDFHVKTAASMLKKCGFSEADLKCGIHYPFDKAARKRLYKSGEKPTQLHNNCSGKHSAMLAFSKKLGSEPSTYLEHSNLVQKSILDSVSLFSGISGNEIGKGIDGCSAPNFAIPLSAMASAFARLIFPDAQFPEETRAACKRIVNAQITYPEYVGGTERLDTKIMRALPGKILSKIGAEGVWCAGILPCEDFPKGLGIALKIEDGDNERARPVVSIEVLRQLGLITEDADELLQQFSPITISNLRNIEVGMVKASFTLKRL